MKSRYRLLWIVAVILGITLSDCQYRKDCGGRRKKKVKTGMGGYI